jgi:hypothetical protein
MATKRIEGGWTLSCGIWPPFLMPSLADVFAALREQGTLRPEPAGLDALHDQWVYAQRWIYAARFECGDEGERFSLRFEHLAGSGEARLNGRTLGRFQPGEWTVDITGTCEPERNELEIAFDPSLPDGAPRGILGPVWLKETSYVELKHVRAWAKDVTIRVQTDLTAHTAGRFLFKYQVSLDGDMALATEVYERLRAADASVEHALKLPAPAAWDGEKYYTVRLLVERSGVGCDSALLNAALDAPAPKRVARIPAYRLRDRDLMRQLIDLGAQAVQPEGMDNKALEEKLLTPDLLADGLLIAEDGPDCLFDQDLLALQDLRMLEKLAGSERFWPAGAPVWRATGSLCPDKQNAEALYGPNALGDAGRYARLSRFVQAETVRALALTARREGRAFAIWAAEGAPAFASPALIEYSGRKRPAFGALRQAWGGCAAFEFPEPLRASLPLKVWLHSSGVGRRPVTVTASVYQLDGTLIASTSFTAMLGENAPLGELKATLPEEGVVIARAELSDGGKTSRIDQVICLTKPGAPPRGALLNPPRSELRRLGGELSCTGTSAALGVFAGGFYGALLPGEKIVLPGGIAPEDIETLNSQIL